MRDFLEFAIGLTGILIVFGLILGVLFGVAHYGVDRPACYAKWAGSDYKARWSFWGDCQISVNGETWMPEDAYREIHKDVKVSQ